MNVNTEKLKTVANYAKSKNITPAGVYWLRDNKNLKTIKIDGVIFVVVK